MEFNPDHWYEFVEPHPSGGVCRVQMSAQQAVDWMLQTFPGRYANNTPAEILLDFIILHTADRIIPQDKVKDVMRRVFLSPELAKEYEDSPYRGHILAWLGGGQANMAILLSQRGCPRRLGQYIQIREMLEALLSTCIGFYIVMQAKGDERQLRKWSSAAPLIQNSATIDYEWVMPALFRVISDYVQTVERRVNEALSQQDSQQDL